MKQLNFRECALYVRVSTDKQDELSPDAQIRLGTEYAKKNGLHVSKEHTYIEHGISGRKADKRPEFLRMIAAAKSEEHPFDVILVWKFSRFARNQEESIVYKSLLRKKCGVDVVSVSEPIIDGPFGGLIERIIEWMDEYYSIRHARHLATASKPRKSRLWSFRKKPKSSEACLICMSTSTRDSLTLPGS